MWVILPAVSLAIVHIAGDNLAVVPDMAAVLGPQIYITTFVAYLIFGVLITGISAWIGVKTGQELIVVVRRIFGCRGKKLMALAILAISIPASALTGGYFSGWIINTYIGIPHLYASILCIALFSILATGWGNELLRVSNYLSLLLVPMLVVLAVSVALPLQESPIIFNIDDINWSLVLALIGYNAGGMRSALVVEAAAYLTRRQNKAIILAVVAKLVEGIITLVLAHIVLMAGSEGPMALIGAVGNNFGAHGNLLISVLVFSTFVNTMVPAMTVNARQIGIVTGLSYRPALAIAFAVVCMANQASLEEILGFMSGTGLLMAMVILLIAYHVHKLPGNK